MCGLDNGTFLLTYSFAYLVVLWLCVVLTNEQSYQLTYRVFDEKHSNTTTVIINILDVNDNRRNFLLERHCPENPLNDVIALWRHGGGFSFLMTSTTTRRGSTTLSTTWLTPSRKKPESPRTIRNTCLRSVSWYIGKISKTGAWATFGRLLVCLYRLVNGDLWLFSVVEFVLTAPLRAMMQARRKQYHIGPANPPFLLPFPSSYSLPSPPFSFRSSNALIPAFPSLIPAH